MEMPLSSHAAMTSLSFPWLLGWTQARGASNIVALRPGLVVAYERNHATNDELRENGVRVKEWEDSYLDMLEGPTA